MAGSTLLAMLKECVMIHVSKKLHKLIKDFVLVCNGSDLLVMDNVFRNSLYPKETPWPLYV